MICGRRSGDPKRLIISLRLITVWRQDRHLLRLPLMTYNNHNIYKSFLFLRTIYCRRNEDEEMLSL